MKLNDNFTFRTVRKKILIVSKLAGILIILSYILSTKLEIKPDVSFAVWFAFVIAIVLVVDFLMGHFISKPISKLNQTARKMAKLDFSVPCTIATNDEEAERMSGLITTLLDLSALDTGASRLIPERFDFVEFLETVAGRLLIEAPDANFELRHELPEHKVYVYTDKARMEQVLDNLIVNAKKNVQPGGILKLSLMEEAGTLHFSIYNQGPPIPQEALPKLWTKFYRDNNSKYSGSGLGLAIVAQILSMQKLDFTVFL